MSPTLVTVDREIVEHSFREWQEEQSLLDAQLFESLAALESYQSHLDSWQQDLVREREELRQLRESLTRGDAAGGDEQQQFDQLNQELRESREKIASLTAALAAAQSAGAANHHQAAFERAVEQAASAEHGAGKVEPRPGASPVLGSVMEQFGKLREQRSLNRANQKTR